MEIEYLDYIDFEPLMLTIKTNQPLSNLGHTVVKHVKDWESHRPSVCNCSKFPLNVFLFEHNENHCRLGIEWICSEVCIPSLSDFLSNQINVLSSLQLGEKHISSSALSYSYISIFDQSRNSLIEATNSIGYRGYLDFDDGESFVFIEDLENFNSGEIVKIGKVISKNINGSLSVWRNLSDDILEIYFFDSGEYDGMLSTLNKNADLSIFQKAKTNFPDKMASMFYAKRPKPKRDLHYNVGVCCEYSIENIGINYKKIKDGKFGLGRRESDYIHFDKA